MDFGLRVVGVGAVTEEVINELKSNEAYVYGDTTEIIVVNGEQMKKLWGDNEFVREEVSTDEEYLMVQKHGRVGIIWEEEEPKFQEDICPKCDSEDIDYIESDVEDNGMSWVLCRCLNCGCRFRQLYRQEYDGTVIEDED